MCREEETEGLMGWGGCHHCSGTSKDSSADVSKQDGCQVSLVNYLSNKNRLVFMRHARVLALLSFFFFVFFLQWALVFLIFELALSFLNQTEAFCLYGLKYLLITQREVMSTCCEGPVN